MLQDLEEGVINFGVGWASRRPLEEVMFELGCEG